MKYIIKYRRQTWPNNYISVFMSMAVDRLIEKYPEHSFEIVRDLSQENKGYGSISSPLNFSVWNPENDKYIVVSSIDNWKNHLMRHLGWQPEKMVKFFYSGGFSFLEYFSLPDKYKQVEDIKNAYRSFAYGPSTPQFQDHITELYENRNPKEDKMIFRGLMFSVRTEIAKRLTHPEIKVIDKRSGGTNLSYESYLKELSEYKAALSLPGMTEICNRDIECFAVGVPVLRPLLHTQYPDPLIPDYHYINFFVDCNYNEQGFPGYTYSEDAPRYLIDKWNRVKKQKDYLQFVSENARAWYLKNCIIENNVEYLLSQIRLEDLNG